MDENLFAKFQEFLAWQGQAVPAPKISELWEAYEAYSSPRIKSWASCHAIHAKHLLPFWGHLAWNDDTWTRADEYVALRSAQPVVNTAGGKKERIVSLNTVAHELATLRACFSWCRKRRLINENPLDGYEDPSQAPREDVPLTPGEAEALIAATRPLMGKWIFGLLLATGMRRDEARLLTWDEVDTTAGVISLPAHRTKAQRARVVPLSDEALRILSMIPRAGEDFVFANPRGTPGPIPESTLDNWFKRALKNAGLEDRRLHSLRHTFVSNATYVHGVPLRAVMMMVGHASLEVHDRYAKTNTHILDEIRRHLNAPRVGPRAVPHSNTVDDTQPHNLAQVLKKY